jgi:hypothetical protein
VIVATLKASAGAVVGATAAAGEAAVLLAAGAVLGVAGAAAVEGAAGLPAVDAAAGAGAVLVAAGWVAVCGSFLPQALSISRPANVTLYRAAVRAESFMGEIPWWTSDEERPRGRGGIRRQA